MNKILKTKRLRLSPLGVKYINSVYRYSSDIENTKYMIFLPSKSIKETREFLERVDREWEKDRPLFYEYAILLDEKQIGAVSLYLDEERAEAEIGWIIDKMYWNNGYATEAARKMIEFADETLEIEWIVAHCDTRNIPSRKVMERLGMVSVLEGARDYPDSRGKAHEYMYRLNLGKK